ncbi:unnamed protein product [Prunus armeniaca]|uniref:Uncharacterized protein n=1 Tax=Prunus armeniaca TaxID=36596 RepID=A0A6J5W2G0_PRUAR|nr:unnamed protein product [Prunus armeniaca]
MNAEGKRTGERTNEKVSELLDEEKMKRRQGEGGLGGTLGEMRTVNALTLSLSLGECFKRESILWYARICHSFSWTWRLSIAH